MPAQTIQGSPCSKCGGVERYATYPHNCVLCARARSLANQAEHRERRCEYKARWRREHPEKQKSYSAAYTSRSVEARLRKKLRCRLYQAVAGGFRAGSAVRDLGCTIPELKTYLESKFQLGMTWGNWGTWHIDHVKPLASFDLSERSQLLVACHYTNLQPLWAGDNLRKGAR